MPSFIYFDIRGDRQFDQLQAAFEALRNDKEAHRLDPEDSKWLRIFGEEALRHFWWPTEQELADYQQRNRRTPPEERLEREDLQVPWEFTSLLDAIRSGNYNLLRCTRNGTAGRLEYEVWSVPFGGTDSLEELIRCFGHSVSIVSPPE
jgi:hypothetical protein